MSKMPELDLINEANYLKINCWHSDIKSLCLLIPPKVLWPSFNIKNYHELFDVHVSIILSQI